MRIDEQIINIIPKCFPLVSDLLNRHLVHVRTLSFVLQVNRK